MTIQSYMTDIGAPFWGSLPISLLIGFSEWIAFLCYVHRYSPAHFFKKRALFLHACALAVILALDIRHYPVSLHCLLLLILFTIHLCILTHCGWFGGVLEGTFFCLVMELGKSICQDSLLAYGIWQLIPSISGHMLNLTLLFLHLGFLISLSLYSLRHRRHMLRFDFTPLQAAGLLFPFLLYLAVRIAQYSYLSQLDNQSWALFDLLQFAVAACALINLSVTQSLLAAQIEKSELTQRQLLMQQKQLQYTQQREAIEDINRRYHDLKHYLNGFEAMLRENDRKETIGRRQAEAFIQTVRREISPYDSMCQTGSDVVDVLLSQRISECARRHIRLLPSIDASNTAFISTLDMCTLFGNAMDNAIEAAAMLSADTLDECSQPEISVKIGTSDNLLLMRFCNPYCGPRQETDGRFHTTKSDAQGHGYGLRSIEDIAQRYDGSISISCDQKEFTLTVLIPVPERGGLPCAG